MRERPDVAICGSGIAGGALATALARNGLSVLVLEQLDRHRDLLRGEMLSPWGIDAAARLGVEDCIYSAGPEPLTEWVQWDEIHPHDAAPSIDLTRRFFAGVPAPLAIRYAATASAYADGARRAGARVVMGARDIHVESGERPTVRYLDAGVAHEVRPRIVFGAGGRHGPIGRQVGLRLDVDSHHWGAGCIVEGLESWPAGVQAFGTEGRRNFMVFPQGGGRARLYLNVGREDARRYSGPYGTRAFLGDFALECLPPELAQLCVDASPLGKAGAGPILRTRMERPFTAGVVLIGDEAGCNDSVLGTGLSCALDDAANVTRLLMDNTVWGASLFEEYALRRNERQKKLHFAAEFYFRLFCEFGPEPRARRARVFERIAANPNFGALQAVPLAGPYRTPSFAFSELLLDRLFGERPTSGSGQAKRRFVLTG